MNNPKLSRNEQLLILVCIVFLAGFLLVTLFRASFHSFDVGVNVWIPSIQSHSFTVIAEGIAVVFDTTILVLFSLVLAAYLFIKNHRAEGLLLLGAMGGDALIVSFVKGLVQSPRPLNGLVVDSGFSFPSGHTAGSIVFCGTLAFFAWQHWKSTRARASIGTGFVAVTSVVGFSRIYLNVHWFSDVLGAVMLGVFWLAFAILVFQFLQDRGKFQSESFRSIAMFLFVVVIAVGVFVVVESLFG
ncbi:MAG: phosphatase PAP2 family protein [Candidatus Bathyarchaeia archaeon]